MRKSDEEITREVFGKGSRWIGWNQWLRYQPVFKFIADKVEEGVSVLSTVHFYVSDGTSMDFDKMIYVSIDHKRGVLETLHIPGSWGGGVSLHMKATSSTYNDNSGTGLKKFAEVFVDPWRPTFEELDLFTVLYGDEQYLIDMDREFYSTISRFNKAALKGTIRHHFMSQ